MLPKYPHHIQAGILLPTGEWKKWRQQGVKVVAERVRRFDAIFAPFADSLTDFTPFFPLEGIIRFVREWARDGLLLIGDAAHTMSPAGAIGVNVALATAAVAAQEIYPRLGRGPIAKADLLAVQRVRETDVRTLHRLQLGAQGVLLGQQSSNPVVRWLVPRVLPWLLKSPLLPRVQRRLFFGAPLPPLDPAFSFGERRFCFLSSGMTCLPNISMDVITLSCGTVSVAIRNCSSSTPAASWMAMLAQAALRIAGDEDAAVDQRVGVDLVPQRASRSARSRRTDPRSGAPSAPSVLR